MFLGLILSKSFFAFSNSPCEILYFASKYFFRLSSGISFIYFSYPPMFPVIINASAFIYLNHELHSPSNLIPSLIFINGDVSLLLMFFKASLTCLGNLLLVTTNSPLPISLISFNFFCLLISKKYFNSLSGM